jgi:hypothetical protein
LADLAGVLQTAGVGTVGIDIFLSQLPLSPEDAISLGEYGGSPPTWVFGDIAWEQPRVQVLVRTSHGYVTGRTKAQAAWSALASIKNEVLNSVLYLTVEPLQSPFELTREGDGDDITFAFNIEIWKQVA